MVKTLSERLQAFFTGCKEGSPVRSREQVNELLRACKRVRGKDYVFPFSMPNGGTSNEIIVTSTANWFFVVTGISSWLEENSAPVRASFSVLDYYPETPFNATPEERGTFPLKEGLSLQFGGGRFEEYKNLWDVLGQRATMSVTAKTSAGEPARGAVIVTGIEFNLDGGL